MVRKWFVTTMMLVQAVLFSLASPLSVKANSEHQKNPAWIKLEEAKKQVMARERQVAGLNEEIAQKKMNLLEKQKKLSMLEARFEAVLVHIYKRSHKNQYLYYLLSANSVSEFLMRLDILSMFVENESAVIKQYLKEKKALENEVAMIEKSKKEKEALLKEARQHLTRYTALYQQQSRTLDPVREPEPEKMQPVRQEDKNRQVRNSHPPASSSPDRHENDTLAWPQPGGKVSSEFGERNGSHEGIDIKNSMGSPIVAAASGIVVLTKSDPGGYGYYIVIDHGNGFKTLYAHMYPSTVQVEVGDRVEKGQQIASVGNYPQLVPYLHFEIHENGKPVDPLQYY